MITKVDIAWFAGLLEGEGCFNIQKNNPKADGSYNPTPRITVHMTDEDVIRTIHATYGGKVYGPYRTNHAHWKPIWRWQTTTAALTAGIMMSVYPFMHSRRQEQIRVMLNAWRYSYGPQGRMKDPEVIAG